MDASGREETHMRNVMLVWHRHQCNEDKTYYVSLEWRDYDKEFKEQIPVNKDFITNLISKMAVLEDQGYIYKCPIPTTYYSEGLT